MKIVSIIGARPQFVKASVVSKAFHDRGVAEVLVNTGQHYDMNMAQLFFDELNIPKPKYHLGVGSGTHAEQTAKSLVGIEQVLLSERPDYTLVYGDTNATIAGALASTKLNIPLIHIEAGLRSFNREMPEEINRIVTDRLSSLLFVPTAVAVHHLKNEGITEGVQLVGDVMVDALLTFSRIAEKKSRILEKLSLLEREFALLTIHRPSNADQHERLSSILAAVDAGGVPVIFPVHPRVRQKVEGMIHAYPNITVVDPVGYLDMMQLEQNAKCIISDSGGIQKEAYVHKTPCLTVRSETEWVETVQDGWNILVGDRLEDISGFMENFPAGQKWEWRYGDGTAAEKIVNTLLK